MWDLRPASLDKAAERHPRKDPTTNNPVLVSVEILPLGGRRAGCRSPGRERRGHSGRGQGPVGGFVRRGRRLPTGGRSVNPPEDQRQGPTLSLASRRRTSGTGRCEARGERWLWSSKSSPSNKGACCQSPKRSRRVCTCGKGIVVCSGYMLALYSS